MMKNTTILLTLITLLLLASTVLALAPPPGLELNWWVISGGETPRDSGSLQINATIGQPAIARTGSGPLMLDWGYWSVGLSQIYQPLILK